MTAMYLLRPTKNSLIDFAKSLLDFGNIICFLKPKNVLFGYSEIDFVGKVLSEKGLKMFQLKIQSVLDFPIVPVVSKQLKSFLGIVNCFRDFVRNASTITKPLHGLIADYH
jgi:hypothetical protein